MGIITINNRNKTNVTVILIKCLLSRPWVGGVKFEMVLKYQVHNKIAQCLPSSTLRLDKGVQKVPLIIIKMFLSISQRHFLFK